MPVRPSSFVPSAITRSFAHFLSYRLEISHGSSYGLSPQNGHPCKEIFAWNPCKKNSMDHGIRYNSDIFELQTQDFAWKFV